MMDFTAACVAVLAGKKLTLEDWLDIGDWFEFNGKDICIGRTSANCELTPLLRPEDMVGANERAETATWLEVEIVSVYIPDEDENDIFAGWKLEAV